MLSLTLWYLLGNPKSQTWFLHRAVFGTVVHFLYTVTRHRMTFDATFYTFRFNEKSVISHPAILTQQTPPFEQMPTKSYQENENLRNIGVVLANRTGSNGRVASSQGTVSPCLGLNPG